MKNQKLPFDLSGFVADLGTNSADKPGTVTNHDEGGQDELETLGQTADELRETAGRLKRLARRKSLSISQQIQIEARLGAILAALARLEDRMAIEDHPDFEGLLSDILTALERTLDGRGVPVDGVRSEFAGHLEVVEAERQRRAA